MMSRRLEKTEKSSIVRRTSHTDGQSVSGSEFHSSGPDTEKLLPYLANLIRGTARSPCVAKRR